MHATHAALSTSSHPCPALPPQGFLGMKDILTALFEWNEVVLFKPHPQLAAYQAVMDLALAPLVAAGYYRSASCGLELTKYMVHHSLVSSAAALHCCAAAAALLRCCCCCCCCTAALLLLRCCCCQPAVPAACP
jgi:hypothetical protein